MMRGYGDMDMGMDMVLPFVEQGCVPVIFVVLNSPAANSDNSNSGNNSNRGSEEQSGGIMQVAFALRRLIGWLQVVAAAPATTQQP